MAFWFSISGVGAMPTCCAVLGWWQTDIILPRCQMHITAYNTVNKLGDSSCQVTANSRGCMLINYSENTLSEHWARWCGYLPSTSSWEVLTYEFWAVFPAFLEHLVLWFCHWFFGLTFEHVLYFGRFRVCLS